MVWLEASPHPIGRVTRVQRPTIKADIPPKTTQLDKTLRAVVTRFAERLEWAEPELIDVAVVRFDVIADCRWGYNAAFEAKLTKRMLQELVLPDPSPAPGSVPSVPFCRLAANAHSTHSSWSPSKALQCERNLPSTHAAKSWTSSNITPTQDGLPAIGDDKLVNLRNEVCVRRHVRIPALRRPIVRV